MANALTKDELNDPVTSHMRRDFMVLRAGQTVAEAMVELRERQPEGRIIYFYVADPEGRLCGVVPTRRLLLSPPDTPLEQAMVKQVIAVPESATVLEACEFFVLHRLLAFPVVDAGRRVIGVVDVDLYTQEMSDLERREGSDDLFQLVGVHLTEVQQANPLLSFRQRFPWLLCNVAGGILAAFLSGLYEAQLERTVALALFIPVVLALAESVSIQSVSLALLGMHGQRPGWSDLLGRLGKESVVGVMLGAGCGLLVGAVALVWMRQWGVVWCVLGGIGGGMAAAAVLGVAVPNVLRLLRLDPQVAAGPVALAAADMATLLLYFNLARWLLG
jgi:magnesium transporter